MIPSELVKVAKWHSRRGVRMLKCASHVESCGHSGQFEFLAQGYFRMRDSAMESARMALSRPKQYEFAVHDPGEFGEMVAVVHAHDELEAGRMFEAAMHDYGIPYREYRVVRKRRTRGYSFIVGKLL